MPRRPRNALRVFALAFGLLGASGLAGGSRADAEGSSLPPYVAPQAGAATQSTGGDNAAPAASQDKSAGDSGKGAGAQDLTELQRDTLFVELSTAGYYELAERARELGLTDAGGADEIRARLYEYYGIKAPEAGKKKGRTVTIERAANAGYAKVEEEEGGIVRASGGVILSLSEANGDTHRIQADTIVYNRARSTLTARGSVSYERRSGSSVQTFTGEALSADLNDWSGVFLDGKLRSVNGAASGGGSSGATSPGSTATTAAATTAAATTTAATTTAATTAAASSGTASSERGVVVQADTIVRRTSNVMVLENGTITGCDEDDPHYAIRAKKVWLLGDKEWAVSNAVFSLGNVPIMWLPFFYYPGDEIVFHPVIGYRSREGRFLQTTTYLIGAKPPKTSTTTIMSYNDTGSGKPTELKGLFLRRVSGPPPKDKGTLKVMADVYSGLGTFTGIAGSFPSLGSFGKTDLYLGIGRSRSLFEEGAIYSPYDSAGDYESVWNSSDFLGRSLPVRFGFNLATTYKSGGLTSSVSLPIYSDPFFEQDFTNRTEDMNWLQMFKSTTDTTTTTISERTQLNPSITTTYSAKPTDFGPYLSSIELTRLTTSAILNTESSTSAALNENATLFEYDPNNTFFYPYVFRPFDASITFKGTLLGAPASAAPSPGQAQKDAKAGDKGNTSSPGDDMRNPWSDPPEEKSDDAASKDQPNAAGGAEAAGDGADSGGTKEAAEDFRLPARAPDPPASKNEDWNGSLGWTMTPSAYYENSYKYADLQSPKDINFSPLYKLYSYKLVTSLDGTESYGDYLSSSISLAYNDQNQERPYLSASSSSETADEAAAEAESYRLADRSFRSTLLTQTSKVTFKPLADVWLWSGSNVSWDMTSTLYGRTYDSSSDSYQEQWLSWTPDMITAHDLSLVAEMRPRNFKQTLSLTATLPPVLESYAGKFASDFGFGSIYTQTRMYRPIRGADFTWDPITTGASLGVAPWPVATDTYMYSIEDSQPQSNVAGLTWGPASISLTSAQTQAYYVDTQDNTGWVPYGDERFTFTSLAIGLAPQLKGDESSKGGPAWSFCPSLNLSQSLVRFTEASLGINLTATYKVNDTLNLSLTSQSLNSSAWRYYPWAFSSELSQMGRSPSEYQVNPITDLWKSLSVWDTNSLKESYIKLQSISLTAAQDLHDWTLSAQLTTKPLYNATNQTYSLDTTFSIILSWKDMPDINSTITRETGEPVTF